MFGRVQVGRASIQVALVSQYFFEVPKTCALGRIMAFLRILVPTNQGCKAAMQIAD
jgi:hypothetical protein